MKQLVNLDNCLPDFFNGHKNAVLVAYYDKNTTINDVLDQLKQDINGQDIDPEWSGYSFDDFDQALAECRKENFQRLELPYMLDCDFEFSEENENDNFPVAYFTVEDDGL